MPRNYLPGALRPWCEEQRIPCTNRILGATWFWRWRVTPRLVQQLPALACRTTRRRAATCHGQSPQITMASRGFISRRGERGESDPK